MEEKINKMSMKYSKDDHKFSITWIQNGVQRKVESYSVIDVMEMYNKEKSNTKYENE